MALAQQSYAAYDAGNIVEANKLGAKVLVQELKDSTFNATVEDRKAVLDHAKASSPEAFALAQRSYDALDKGHILDANILGAKVAVQEIRDMASGHDVKPYSVRPSPNEQTNTKIR